MKKTWMIVFLLATLFAAMSSCTPSPAIKKNPDKPVETSNTQAPDIGDFEITIEKNVLAPGEKTRILLNVPKGIKYEAAFEAEYGSVQSEGSQTVYAVPESMPPDAVDTITATVTVGGRTLNAQACVLVLDDQLAGQWVKTGGPQGGTITALEVDRKNAGVMYAAGSGARIFKSLDNGDSWRGLKIDEDSTSGAFYDIKINSGNADVVYTVYNRDLVISRDAGEHWERALRDAVASIAVREELSNVILVTQYDGQVLFSADSGESFRDITGNLPQEQMIKSMIVSDSEFWVATKDNGSGQIYKTVDAGKSWNRIELDYPPEADPHSLYVDPADHNTVYVSFKNFQNEMLRGETVPLYLQKTTDGGQTWKPLKLPNADAMICVLGKSDKGALYVSSGGMVFQSMDGGDSWMRIDSGARNGDIVDIGFDAGNPECVFLPTARSGIMKSADNGKTWELKVQGLDNLKTSLLATPPAGKGQTVYVSSVGGEGIFKTQDFGKTWMSVMNDDTIHPWGDELQVNPTDPDEIWYIADVGNVYVTRNGGQTWEKRFDPSAQGLRFGSVYALAAAPSNGDVMYAIKNGFGLFKTTDGGNSWGFLDQSEVDYTYTIAVDPQNPDIAYSGYNPKPFQNFAMIRGTRDGGVTWKTKLMLEGSKGVTSVAIDPSHPQTVYAGSIGDDAGLWVSQDEGESWGRLCEPLTFANVHTMATDPNRPDVAYAGVWGGGTYKTEDRGNSWTRLAYDPTDSAVAILLDRNDKNALYLADRTTPRIFKSADEGKTWATYFDAGKDYYRVMAAAISQDNPSVLYASVLKNGSPFEGAMFRIENANAVQVGENLDRLPISIGVDPRDCDHVLIVSHAGGVYESRDGGHSWSPISGNSAGSSRPVQNELQQGRIRPRGFRHPVFARRGRCRVDFFAAFRHRGRIGEHDLPLKRWRQELGEPRRWESGRKERFDQRDLFFRRQPGYSLRGWRKRNLEVR